MEEWKEYKLGDICDFQEGYVNPPQGNPEYFDGDIKWLRATDLNDGYVYSTTRTLTQLGFKSAKKSAILFKPGTIAISKSGTIGRLGILQDYMCGNRAVINIIPHHSVNTHFVFFVLRSYQRYFPSMAVGSVQKNLYISILEDLKIKLPDFNTQERIVSILKSLDDKIDNNRRVNENLKQQAQALFKSWFVEFEPFKDGEFMESELGMIPKGWRVGTLGEICSQLTMKVGSRNDVKVLSPVTTGKLMLSEEYFTKQVYSESISKYKVVNKGAFAYNPARVNIGSLGRNEYDFDGAVSPVYVVFDCKKGYSNFFDLFRTTEKFKTEVLLRAIGGVRQSLNYVDFAMIQTIIAPQDVVDAFNPLFERIKTMQKHLEEENDRLDELRDTLLPRLMSGEIQID